MLFLTLVLFLTLGAAQTCNVASATTCAQTYTTCIQAAGNNVAAVCTCARNVISCFNSAGCCSDPTFGNTCQAAQNTINQQCGSAACFHKDTVITYEGKSSVLAELQKSAHCIIPHIVGGLGTTITARCGSETKVLRLTSNHLVYTQRGLQTADSLVVGKDVVYADLKETMQCTLVSVEKDKEYQEFFGLNCYSSEVLASGIKTSTFEKLHSIPAFWMQIMGKILGIKRASAVGDHIEKILSKLNLI